MQTLALGKKNTFNRNAGAADTKRARRIAFVHHKGGTGKTTSCLNIAGWLTKMKQKVLVVDLDPQGNATAGLGVNRAALDGSLYDALFGELPLEEIILETVSGVYLAPSSLDLLSAEMRMAGQASQTGTLRRRLDPIQSYFDYILLDGPPASTQLMINGIVAAEEIVIPIDSGVFGYETLETLRSLVLDLQEELHVEVPVSMVLLRELSTSISDWGLTQEIRRLVSGFLMKNGLSNVRIRSIPFSREVYRAQMKGMPISHFAPLSAVGKAYLRVAKELVNNAGLRTVPE